MRPPRADPLALAVLLLALLGTRAAFGQEGMTEEERMQEAVRLSDLGRLHFEGHEFAEAAEDFARAWDLHPDPVLGYNAARSYENAGDPDQALTYYKNTLDLQFDDEDLRDRCRDGLARIRNLLATVEEERQHQPATLQVRSSPAGAAVRIDGQDRGVTPADITLDPGSYVVDMDLDGFAPQEQQVDLAPAQVLVLSVTLAEPPPTPTPPEAESGPNWLAVGLTGGSGVALIILGALSAAAAHDRFDEAQQPDVLRNTDQFNRVVQRGKALQGGSNLFYGVGMLAVVTAVVLYFVTDHGPEATEAPAGARLDLGVGPTGVTAGMRVGF